MFKIELNSLRVYETFKIVLGDNVRYTDLYYYCLDNTFLDHKQDQAKGLLNFVCMIENWKIKLKNLEVNASTALPFDYSDQYIGFYVVTKISNENITIQDAYTTEYSGPLINPSQLNLEQFIDKPHEVEGEKYTMSLKQLLDSIESSMSTIFSSFYKANKNILS